MNGTVLVVDDIQENRDILTRILERKGFGVTIATNGEEAIEAAKTNAPDLILLDINMPKMDGYETCRILKQDPELASVPVIFVSARTDAVDKLEAFGSGGVDYIIKPFDFREVIARVNTHIELRLLQKKLELSYQKLKELEDTRDKMVGMIIHDMRSPFSVLTTALHLLELEAGEHFNEETRADLLAAKSNAHELSAMADNLLEVRGLESNTIELKIVEQNLLALLNEVVSQTQLLGRDHEFVVDVPEDLTLPCDPYYLRRTFTNLISNAIKAMPEPGTITLKASVSGDVCHVSISDTGVGIPEEARESLFNAFVASQNVPGYESTRSIGLGLALCRLTAEALGGEIQVESTQGQGSTFTLQLPLKQP